MMASTLASTEKATIDTRLKKTKRNQRKIMIFMNKKKESEFSLKNLFDTFFKYLISTYSQKKSKKPGIALLNQMR